MKRVAVLLGMGLMLFLSGSGVAEASKVGDALGHTWGYLTAPVNCLVEAGRGLVAVGTQFVICVLQNINPSNLVP